ncbi:molt-inhibiting hormone-like [Scylla paramamosain]
MMSCANSKFSYQRMWLLAVVVMAALWSLSVQRTAARMIDDECPNLIGNRDLYEKVDWICEDCANIFRKIRMGYRCRRNCFYNEEFTWCISATENTEHKKELMQWVAILRATPERHRSFLTSIQGGAAIRPHADDGTAY